MLRFPCNALLPVLAAIAALTTGCAGAPRRPLRARRAASPSSRASRTKPSAARSPTSRWAWSALAIATAAPIRSKASTAAASSTTPMAKPAIDVPRTSRELFRAARKISVGEADPGDLMFFQDQTKLSHVGIYLGDGLLRARAGERPERRRRQPRLAVLSRAPRRGRPAAAALRLRRFDCALTAHGSSPASRRCARRCARTRAPSRAARTLRRMPRRRSSRRAVASSLTPAHASSSRCSAAASSPRSRGRRPRARTRARPRLGSARETRARRTRETRRTRAAAARRRPSPRPRSRDEARERARRDRSGQEP